MNLPRTSIARTVATLACLSVLLAWCENAAAQAGNLDPSFDGDGLVVTDLGAQENGFATVIQPDGKIVVAGTRTTSNNLSFLLLRYHPAGDLDLSFGNQGVVLTDIDDVDQAEEVALQPDGKILAAGSAGTDFALARYGADGSLDVGFGSGGTVLTDFGASEEATSVVLERGGRILTGGYERGAAHPDFQLTRHHADGSLDSSFGNGGLVQTSFGNMTGDTMRGMARQPDGRVVLVGTTTDFSGSGSEQEVALARYCAGLAPFELSALQLAFFDQCVANGTLLGVGPPRVAWFRLWLMRALLRSADRLINRGEYDLADYVLLLAYLHSDGQTPPRDLVTGPASSDLAQGMQLLRAALAGPCTPMLQ